MHLFYYNIIHLFHLTDFCYLKLVNINILLSVLIFFFWFLFLFQIVFYWSFHISCGHPKGLFSFWILHWIKCTSILFFLHAWSVHWSHFFLISPHYMWYMPCGSSWPHSTVKFLKLQEFDNMIIVCIQALSPATIFFLVIELEKAIQFVTI